jgi:gas vesicle protein
MYPEDRFEFTSLPDEGFDAGRFITGLVAGAAIGAGLALLFAPQAGEDSRKDIADVYAHLADRAADTVDTVRDKVVSSLEDVRERTVDAVDSTRGSVEDWIARSKKSILETRERLDDAVDAGRQAYETRRAELDAQVEATLAD